jgi:hypothetical protein
VHSQESTDRLKLSKLEKQTRVLSISLVMVSLLVIVLALFYSFPDLFKAKEPLQVSPSLALSQKIDSLKLENQELRAVQQFYMARKLLDNDTIYSVQTGMLPIESTGLLSPGLSNALIIEAKPYLKFSIGLYETFEEANALRKGLVKLGFTDAFVASYKGTTRLKIHRAQ